MKIFKYISLLLVPSFILFNSAYAADIKLVSSDKKEFTVDKALIIALSGLVNSALEGDADAREVPLPGVSSDILNFLINTPYLQYLNSVNTPSFDLRNLLAISKLLDTISDEQLIELIKAGNYLDLRDNNHLFESQLSTRIAYLKTKIEILDKLAGPSKKLVLQLTKPMFELNLARAIQENDVNKVKQFIELGADVNSKRYDFLIDAVISGNKEIVQILINAKADLNKKGTYHKTALKYANEKGYAEIAELLKQAGAKE